MSWWKLSILLIIALSSSMAFAAAQTVLILNSQPGDWVGAGQQLSFTPADGPFTVAGTVTGGLQVFFHTPDYSHFWYVAFGPPNSRKLATGQYEGAQSVVYPSIHPDLQVSGDGRGCETVGRFFLSDLAFNLDGTVARVAIDFEQHCTGVSIGPALYGSVRYNSGSKLAPRLGIGGGSAMKGNAGTSGDRSSLPSPCPTAIRLQFITPLWMVPLSQAATTCRLLEP
jgi:hypothetical protein